MTLFGKILNKIREMAYSRQDYETLVTGQAHRLREHLLKLLAFKTNDSSKKWAASVRGSLVIVAASTTFRKKLAHVKSWLTGTEDKSPGYYSDKALAGELEAAEIRAKYKDLTRRDISNTDLFALCRTLLSDLVDMTLADNTAPAPSEILDLVDEYLDRYGYDE